MDLANLIEALSNPAAYPQPVERVEVRQTHISVVLLAGPHIYKVKKPVNPGFLDFSTLEKRLHFCREEVRLNRRLAPDVYLGVVPVVQTESGLRLEGAGEVVEWAVKMRRLPEEATILERLQRGEVGIELVESLARKIASFHRTAETNERIAEFGRFDAVSRIVLDVHTESASQVGTTVSPTVFERIRERTEQTLSRLRPLIERRAGRGMPRDTHGDLHLDHIYSFPDKEPPADLVIIDCIEFNERFRFIDPVADMAFVVMDLAFHGRRDLARAFADAYFVAAEDEEGQALLPLYTAYRAMVRGSVEGLLLKEGEVPEAERDAARRKAKAHWLLALGELEEPERKPCLLLTAGLPGSGKTTLAQGLAGRAGFVVIRSDVVRKELAGLSGQGPPTGETPIPPPQLGESFYTREWNERTYAECLRRAEQLLFEGKRVIVDATFREENQRRTFLEAAVRWGVPASMLLCRAEPATVRGRLARRQRDASDADWSVYLRSAETWEEVGALTRPMCHVIATEGGSEEALSRALEVLRLLGLQE
jgi:aminoglycoside phosphotransferase family enzyme/predicted kinase